MKGAAAAPGLQSMPPTRHSNTMNDALIPGGNGGQPGGNGGRTLVYVHGRHFKPAAADLMDICIAAMRRGIERDVPQLVELFDGTDKRIAYYGDLNNAFLREIGQRYDPDLDLGDRRNALHGLCSIEKRKNFGVGRYDRLPGKTAIAEFAADLAAPLLGTLGLSEKIIAKIAVDLAEYWNGNSDFGPRIRERVRNTICEAAGSDGRVMLVSHGTGCIVCYDALWELSHDPEFRKDFEGRKIDLWLTLGAPLGDSTVQRKLLGARKKGRARYPTNIVSWHNLSAEDDYMCHDNTVANDFRQMLKLKLVSCIKDYRIYNLAVRYGKSNPHSSVGYLVHPRVARILADWVAQNEMASVPRRTY